jgi:anti-sigma B factor antagonist
VETPRYPLQVTIEEIDGAVVCRLVGELDANTAPQLREAVGAFIGTRRLVVDAGGVPFIDSAGLGALIGLVRRVRDGGGVVAVATQRDAVRRLLGVAGFERIAPLTATIAEATEAISRAAARATPVAVDAAPAPLPL